MTGYIGYFIVAIIVGYFLAVFRQDILSAGSADSISVSTAAAMPGRRTFFGLSEKAAR